MRPIDADALETKQKTIYMGFDNVAVPTRVISIADLHLAPTVDTMPKWISVEERLPEDLNERVLVHIEYGDCLIGDPDEDTDRFDPIRRRWVRYGYLVTHWMPLPKPPKEDAH